MKKILHKFYHKFILGKPTSRLGILRKEILEYYSNMTDRSLNEEEAEVLSFLKKNKPDVFPYRFTKKYDHKKIRVFRNEELGLNYVIENGKRLYFKRSWDANEIQKKYNFLLMEQDMDSPHRYLTNNFDVKENTVVADIGVAEGNFALSIIEKVKKIYVFEMDDEWIEALKATFEPWKEKIEIVNKFVSDKNDNQNVSLDIFFKDKELDFLKIDVDGAEAELLRGVENILTSNKPFQLAICTYHNQEDQHLFAEHLVKRNFRIEYSRGYMLFIHDHKPLQPPYLRRGLIRAIKN